MIYVDNSKGTAQVFLPVNGFYDPAAAEGVNASLTVTSTVDLTQIEIPLAHIGDLWAVGQSIHAPYIEVYFDIPEGLFEGEWQYKLTANYEGARQAVSDGLMQVTHGDAAPEQEYNKIINYKQYGE